MIDAQLLLAAAVAVLLVVAAITDAYHRIIPNWLTLAIALLALPYWWATGMYLWPDVAFQLGIASVMFAIFLFVFAIGQMGGGDVKLIVALALFLDPLSFTWAIYIFALVGAVQTIVMLVPFNWQILTRKTHPGFGTTVALVRRRLRRDRAKFENPYGIAIAIGGLVALSQRYLNHLS